MLFPADCDHCGKKLSSRDFTRICLRCVVKLDNVGKQAVCLFCYHLMKNHRCPACDQVGLIGKEEKKIYYESNLSLFFNLGQAKKLIYDYKFSRHQSYATIIARLMVKKYDDQLACVDHLIPITLGRQGLFERDFCPVMEVTKKIGRIFHKPVSPVLKRNEQTYQKAQHQRSLLERQEMRGKYSYLSKFKNYLSGQKILLLDDVFTTGYTLNYVAKLISEHNEGCRIITFTFLKTLLDQPDRS